ncbi:DUF6573 family protein [Streptomyces marianii]|uniref:DUF6573 family protein n=1 Tax=Streptomyces marianii TaxID=1817406 RepID=UPI0014865C91|nr:DUF6573 family protein [Streptomyces marianii]
MSVPDDQSDGCYLGRLRRAPVTRPRDSEHGPEDGKLTRRTNGSRDQRARDMDDEYGPVVAAYTRAEFIRSGDLIEIPPKMASDAGFEVPLLITAGAREEFVGGTDGGEDERLSTVLSAVAGAVAQAPANEVCFVVPAEDLPATQASTGADRLLAITEPGDTGELVMTLMLPTEM